MALVIHGYHHKDATRSLYLPKRPSRSYPFISNGLARFSYHKLPAHQIKLSVVKLDGSSFDVQIEGNATVRELKEAVENVFTRSPKEGEGEISWSHVWWHFCLCYEDQKLVHDKDNIKSFGIKDDDQLYFIRYLSIQYNVMKRRSKRETVIFKEQPLALAGSNVTENEEIGEVYYVNRHTTNTIGEPQNEDIKFYNYSNEGGEDSLGHPEFKLAHFFKGWLSYSKLWFVGRAKSRGKFRRPSRFSGQFSKLGSMQH